MRRQRSQGESLDAASALVAFAASPEQGSTTPQRQAQRTGQRPGSVLPQRLPVHWPLPAQHPQQQQQRHRQRPHPYQHDERSFQARPNSLAAKHANSLYDAARMASVDSVRTAQPFSDDEQVSLGVRTRTSSPVHSDSSVGSASAPPYPVNVPPQRLPAAQPGAATAHILAKHEIAVAGSMISQQADAKLLTATCVFLAACGVSHALSVWMANPESKQDDSAPPPSLEDFRSSVHAILREECAHVRPLGRSDFARLCQILDLPLEVGAEWRSRILLLQEDLQPRAPLPAGQSASSGGACAEVAAMTFQTAVLEDAMPSKAGVRRFGRQTVWCTVALLRRLLKEASWQTGKCELTAAQAEARLASLAVAVIGGSERKAFS